MTTKIEDLLKTQLKKDLPDIRPGDTVRIYQKKEGKEKEKSQIFEGLVIAVKHGKGISGTMTVRKVISGIGVERIFPFHSPLIEKMEIVKRAKVRRAKLYFLRKAKGKRSKLKKKELSEAIVWEMEKPQPSEEKEESKSEEKEKESETKEEKAENKQEKKSSQEDKKEKE